MAWRIKWRKDEASQAHAGGKALFAAAFFDPDARMEFHGPCDPGVSRAVFLIAQHLFLGDTLDEAVAQAKASLANSEGPLAAAAPPEPKG